MSRLLVTSVVALSLVAVILVPFIAGNVPGRTLADEDLWAIHGGWPFQDRCCGVGANCIGTETPCSSYNELDCATNPKIDVLSEHNKNFCNMVQQGKVCEQGELQECEWRYQCTWYVTEMKCVQYEPDPATVQSAPESCDDNC